MCEWGPEQEDVYEIVIAIFTVTLLNKSSTLQSVIGMCTSKIRCEDPLDRAKCAAECIAICAIADIIEIVGLSGTYMVHTTWQLDTDILKSNKHVILTRKPVVKTDKQMLGCRYKRQAPATCLNHINRMNGIQLSLNLPLLRAMSEKPTFQLDTTQKKEQWTLFIKNSYKTYLELARGDNKFYLEWKYDTRGRCYSEGYYINPQGSSFKKAICQLAHKEIVNLEIN